MAHWTTAYFFERTDETEIESGSKLKYKQQQFLLDLPLKT